MGFEFANLLGVPYSGGLLTFTQDGNTIVSAAGNRISLKDLITHAHLTLKIECRQDISHILLVERTQKTDRFAVIVDKGGIVLFVNLTSQVILARMSLKKRVTAAAVSPNQKYVSFAYGTEISTWEMPSRESQWRFAKIWEQRAHADRCTSLVWSKDSNYILTASRDVTVKIWAVSPPTTEWHPLAFVDHRTPVIYACFSEDNRQIMALSDEGVLIVWQWEDIEDKERSRAKDIRPSRFRIKDEERQNPKDLTDVNVGDRKTKKAKKIKVEPVSDETSIFGKGSWILLDRSFIDRPAPHIKISTASFDAKKRLLAVGLTDGTLILQECLPTVAVYKVSIGSSTPISTLTFNSDGEWLAIGIRATGQLCVWEWKSETYILRNHEQPWGARSVTLMPSGVLDPFSHKVKESASRLTGDLSRSLVASGGNDGRLTLWDVANGTVLSSFQEHTGPITGCKFTVQLNAVVSCSLDGSVKAYDLVRHKVFRSMKVPELSDEPAPQFGCVDIDASGEIVVAGSSGSDCRVYLWALQTGNLLESFQGHTQPVTAVAFSPSVHRPGLIASSSLDGTTRVWDVYGRVGKGGAVSSLDSHNKSAAVALCFDPRANGKISVSYVGGSITIWDIESEEVVNQIEGLRDIHVGRVPGQKTTTNNSRRLHHENKGGENLQNDADPNLFFSTIAYSADGAFLICAAAQSPKICVYSTDSGQLAYSFHLTHNRDIDGLLRQLNSKYMTEAGITERELDLSEDDLSDEEKIYQKVLNRISVPGSKLGALANQAERRKLTVWDLKTSSDGRELVIATSHGLFFYNFSGSSTLSAMNGSIQLNQMHKLSSFAPVLLTAETTKQNIIQAIAAKEFARVRQPVGLIICFARH